MNSKRKDCDRVMDSKQSFSKTCIAKLVRCGYVILQFLLSFGLIRALADLPPSALAFGAI